MNRVFCPLNFSSHPLQEEVSKKHGHEGKGVKRKVSKQYVDDMLALFEDHCT